MRCAGGRTHIEKRISIRKKEYRAQHQSENSICGEFQKIYKERLYSLFVFVREPSDQIEDQSEDRGHISKISTVNDLQEHSRPKTSILRIAKRFFTAREYEAILTLAEDDAAVIPESTDSPAVSDHSATPAQPDNPISPPACGNSANPPGSGSSDGRRLLFYRLWSIKEAYLKYLGCGLRGGMNGYLPDPLPDSRYAEEKAGRTQANPGNAPKGTDSGNVRPIELIPQAGSGKDSMENLLPRGKILVINNDPSLAPAEYALAQAPENYTLAVCAETIPAEILIKVI